MTSININMSAMAKKRESIKASKSNLNLKVIKDQARERQWWLYQ